MWSKTLSIENHSVTFIQQSEQASIHLNNDMRIVYMNQPFAKIYGIEMNEWIGKILWEDNLLHCFRWLNDIPIASFLLDTSYLFEQFDHELHSWYEVRITRTIDLIMITILDITEIKYEEFRLRERENRYRNLVEQSPETISLHNGETFLYINPAGVQLFQAQNMCELIGQSIWNFVHEEDQSSISNNIKQLLSGKKKVTQSMFRIVLNNKEPVYVEAISMLTTYKGEVVIRSILKDISEKHKMEDIIRKSDKLAVVSQLAAGVAHEIRNPLTTVKGFLQFIKSEKEFNEEYINIVLRELGKMEEIMYEYLTLANPNHETDMKEIDLENLLKQVIKLTHTQAILKNIEYTVRVKNIPKVFGDEKQLKQVFINIIQNAIDAVADKGRIEIQARSVLDKVEIKVTDNGCGMPRERIDRLGEPYFSTKEKGTGIGLMVCMKILSNHKGTMSFESEEGAGTAATITLPIYYKKETFD